jgi:transposase
LVKGRKRHIVVDTLGLLIAVVVTAANVQSIARKPGGGDEHSAIIERIS